MQFIFCVRFIFIKKGCYRKKIVVAIATNYLFVIFLNEEKSAENSYFTAMPSGVITKIFFSISQSPPLRA